MELPTEPVGAITKIQKLPVARSDNYLWAKAIGKVALNTAIWPFEMLFSTVGCTTMAVLGMIGLMVCTLSLAGKVSASLYMFALCGVAILPGFIRLSIYIAKEFMDEVRYEFTRQKEKVK